MKVIELLNKIADGKAVYLPQEIKYRNQIWGLYISSGDDFINYENKTIKSNWLLNNGVTNILNDEIELIEEDKQDKFSGVKWFADGKEVASISNEGTLEYEWPKDKPIEKLDYYYKNTYGRISQHKASETDIIDKINELVKAVNKLNKESGK